MEPDQAQAKVLDLLKQMFGIDSVASMSLAIAGEHSHAAADSTSESLRQGAGSLSYDYQRTAAEVDHTALTASGSITLQDGRSFQLDLSWERTVAVVQRQSVSMNATRDDGSRAPSYALPDSGGADSPASLLLSALMTWAKPGNAGSTTSLKDLLAAYQPAPTAAWIDQVA